MSNLQNPYQDDKVVAQAGQIKQVDKLVLDIKREYGSVRAFSSQGLLPIVTYTASADGTTPMEACTDLSLLRPAAVAELQKILSEHHNSKLLKLISELSHLLNDLYGSLGAEFAPDVNNLFNQPAPSGQPIAGTGGQPASQSDGERSREHFSDHPNYGDLEEFGDES